MKHVTDLLTAAQAQNLLNEYGPFLGEIADKIKNESYVDITGSTSDEIALQYKEQQGIRRGVTLFLQRINSKANE